MLVKGGPGGESKRSGLQDGAIFQSARYDGQIILVFNTVVISLFLSGLKWCT